MGSWGLVAFSAWYNVRFLVYCVTTERIEVGRGWIAKKIENLDLFRVLDVRLKVGILDCLVGIGNVSVISTDKSTPSVMIRGLPNARAVYDRLKHEAVRADRRRGVVHVET
jgi:membrane protein YdbS with pleckstrin-like domain